MLQYWDVEARSRNLSALKFISLIKKVCKHSDQLAAATIPELVRVLSDEIKLSHTCAIGKSVSALLTD